MGKIKYIGALLIAVACVGLQQAKADVFAGNRGAQVPDGGTTVMLLGVALGTLAVARRYLRR